jgi:hypothetical protein
MSNITLEPEQFTLTITATKRELLELADIVSRRLNDDQNTSGDNPVWGFLTTLECVLEGLDTK